MNRSKPITQEGQKGDVHLSFRDCDFAPCGARVVSVNLGEVQASAVHIHLVTCARCREEVKLLVKDYNRGRRDKVVTW